MRGAAILRQAPAPQHDYVAIPEEDILPACQALAQRGFYVEPTSALVWAAWERLRGKIPQPVVLILTGSGLKYAG
jgi:threonine synthase